MNLQNVKLALSRRFSLECQSLNQFIEKKAEIDLLPVIIREQIRNWIDTNYKEIIRPWERISSAKSLKR